MKKEEEEAEEIKDNNYVAFDIPFWLTNQPQNTQTLKTNTKH